MERGRRGAATEKGPGLGKGDPASAMDPLYKPLPYFLSSVSLSEHKTGAVKHDRKEVWVLPSWVLLPAPPLNNWVASGRSLHLYKLQLLKQYDEDKRRLNLVSRWVSRSRP